MFNITKDINDNKELLEQHQRITAKRNCKRQRILENKKVALY